MASKLISAVKRNIVRLNPNDKWLPDNLHYEVIMGSQAYGVSTDSSDMDIYGFAIPPKNQIFPHLTGYVGFGPAPTVFEQYQKHGIQDTDKAVEYDFTVYNVIKYMNLVAENNPNMIDSLFVPLNCVTHITEVGQMLRNDRKKFLHKGAFQKFKGYAYSQIHKIRTKQTHPGMSTKRRESIEKFGFDVKFAYHCVRLLDECEQILTLHDIDLQRNREQLKSIRRGEWTLEYLIQWFEQKEKHLEDLHNKCTLPDTANMPFLNQLLLNMLEHHYGSLGNVGSENKTVDLLVAEINSVLSRYQ